MADALKNFAFGTVLTAPSPASSGTSLVLNSGQGANFAVGNAVCWPPGVQPSSSNAEIFRITAVSTDTLTITRAQEGTTAQSIAVGWQVQQGVTAALLAEYAALSGATFTGAVTSPDLTASGLTGATSASRYVGATASGAPTSGTFAVGDFVIDQTGKVWVCTTAGTPGTWTQVGGAAGLSYQQSFITANVTLPSTGAATNITSLSLSAGTWLIIGQVSAVNGASAQGMFGAISPTSNSYTSAYSGIAVAAPASIDTGLTVTAIVALAATTTVYLVGGSGGFANITVESGNPITNASTGLIAVKIA